ncbi:MAG TPA: hypothetical protein VHJ78_04215 [Actinomycetota bacterium]|nr:hypothetical protein [Actinomycetota bacterium]
MPKHSVRLPRHKTPTISSIVIGVLVVMLTGLSLVFIDKSASLDEPKEIQGQPQAAEVIEVEEEMIPLHREPAPQPAPAAPAAPAPAPAPAPAAAKAPAAAPKPPATAKPAPAPAAAPAPRSTASIDPYRGFGAWVDIYDYAIRDTMDIPNAVDVMAAKGVKTLYLQTSRWKDPADIVNVGAVNQFLELSHAKGMKVVGWYVPGFGNLDRDLRRSMVVLEHKTPGGHQFDGFAPDIETREEVGGDNGLYNAGVAEYSRRLRAQVPNAALGAIVDDAKNNLRAPSRHAGFPWNEIGANYDVVLPMAYWTVTKGKRGGCGTQYDADAYIREVISLTRSYMGVDKPIHPVGGIADCVTEAEVVGYVAATNALGIGGSFYDFATTQSSSVVIWKHLAGLK